MISLVQFTTPYFLCDDLVLCSLPLYDIIHRALDLTGYDSHNQTKHTVPYTYQYRITKPLSLKSVEMSFGRLPGAWVRQRSLVRNFYRRNVRPLHQSLQSLSNMASTLVGPVEAIIVEKLQKALSPSHLQVINESHMHNVYVSGVLTGVFIVYHVSDKFLPIAYCLLLTHDTNAKTSKLRDSFQSRRSLFHF